MQIVGRVFERVEGLLAWHPVHVALAQPAPAFTYDDTKHTQTQNQGWELHAGVS